MRRRLLPLGFVLVVAGLSTAGRSVVTQGLPPLVVHEWGTWTSVAGPDGDAVEWSPLSSQQDLPCFVERYAFCIKCSLRATVRMETPVIYFYAPEPMTARVDLRFRQGLITEWYPRATVTPKTTNPTVALLQAPGFAGTASWPSVSIAPASAARFPDEGRASHYYLARDTAAAPLQVDGQHEKFLFYRGVATFQPPLAVTVDPDDRIRVRARSGGAVGDVIRFENRGGVMAYEVVRSDATQTAIASPRLEGETVPPTAELERLLVARGLYADEARAMIATWRDSWFEEGSRLFYLAATHDVDAVLPLEIQPRPRSTVRVFVGRIELPTSATRNEILIALKSGNQRGLVKYARFAEPLGAQAIAAEPEADRARWQPLLNTLAFTGSGGCRD